jgi:hypothetical protein
LIASPTNRTTRINEVAAGRNGDTRSTKVVDLTLNETNRKADDAAAEGREKGARDVLLLVMLFY